jgi:hypothetical protein
MSKGSAHIQRLTLTVPLSPEAEQATLVLEALNVDVNDVVCRAIRDEAARVEASNRELLTQFWSGEIED